VEVPGILVTNENALLKIVSVRSFRKRETSRQEKSERRRLWTTHRRPWPRFSRIACTTGRATPFTANSHDRFLSPSSAIFSPEPSTFRSETSAGHVARSSRPWLERPWPRERLNPRRLTHPSQLDPYAHSHTPKTRTARSRRHGIQTRPQLRRRGPLGSPCRRNCPVHRHDTRRHSRKTHASREANRARRNPLASHIAS